VAPFFGSPAERALFIYLIILFHVSNEKKREFSFTETPQLKAPSHLETNWLLSQKASHYKQPFVGPLQVLLQV
jgi:hypothetical protein